MIKRTFRSLLILVLITGWIFSGWPNIQIAEAVSTETFTTTTTWTAPTGVTSVDVEVWGGGGGGGGMNATSDGGGGGGGGAYSKSTITVVPANNYTVTVGAAGTGSSGCTASTAGGDSWFSTTGTILAKGGSPGACSTGTPPAGGAGGAAGSGVGTTKFSGGQGEIGRNNASGSGGYGGSSAGTVANGFSGPQTWSTVTYPTASTPTGGGHGGNAGGIGVNGSAPASGNGGGGGGAGEGSPKIGGAGAVGKMILTYNKPPNAPTQDSPANAATGVSVTPTFLMTATDADTTVDNLSYKVTIYSNSACTTVVQTNDQAVSATGWTGSDATCTASPTACYLSGTQGSFLTQTALSASTQYWWKASAKDPDGNGSFTDSSTCNTFTTGAASSLTFTVSTNNFPTITPGSAVFATTTLSVDTNNTSGWNITVSRDDADTTLDLDTDATVNITDQTAWAPGAATTTAGNAVRISSLDSTGDVLGLRVMTASGTVAFRAGSWWGTTDAYVDSATTLWAGLPSTAKQIGNSSVSCSGTNCALPTNWLPKMPYHLC